MSMPLKQLKNVKYFFQIPSGWFQDVSDFLNQLWAERQISGGASSSTIWSAKPTFVGGKLASIEFREFTVTGAIETGEVETVSTGACSAP